MPETKLTYWGIKGLAEPLRIALSLADVDFVDERVSLEDAPQLIAGGTLPLGQVPVLTVDGVKYTQCQAILRYAGRLAGLYPEADIMEKLYVDEMISAISDIQDRVVGKAGPDRELKKAARENVVQNDIPRFFGGMEKIVKSKATSTTWLCGESMTIADLHLSNLVAHVENGILEFVPKDCLDSYPRLLASHQAVLEHPGVKKWNDEHPWDQGMI